MVKNNTLCQILGIEHPIIMAPMFLVSNEKMVLAALESGITAAIPALNYRTTNELRDAIQNIKKKSDKPFGINIIVHQSNVKAQHHLQICLEEKVDFIITSLGKPKEVIDVCKPKGIKVFCDVTDLEYAKKVEKMGADAIIAVGSEAGGHSGAIKSDLFIAELTKNIQIPIISAGGIANYKTYSERMNQNIAGVSIGTVFIASDESPVSGEYKNACILYGEKDIVMTKKLSGTPCTVINTPYVKKWNTSPSRVSTLFQKNKKLKKISKALLFYLGFKKLSQAAFDNSYQQVWCAGISIEHVHSIRSIKEIVYDLISPKGN